MGHFVIVYNDIGTFTIKTSTVVFYYMNEQMKSAFYHSPIITGQWSRDLRSR